MQKEKEVKILLTEYRKLRAFVKSLDIPINAKDSLLRDVEYAEKEVLRCFQQIITDELLKNLNEPTIHEKEKKETGQTADSSI